MMKLMQAEGDNVTDLTRKDKKVSKKSKRYGKGIGRKENDYWWNRTTAKMETNVTTREKI